MFPKEITAIGDEAFAGSDLKRITVPDGVTCIGARAFRNCKKLRAIVLPVTVARIGKEAFEGCKELSRIVLPDGLEVISKGMFRGCVRLRTVELPDTIHTIHEEAFRGSSVKELTLSENVRSVEANAFSDLISFPTHFDRKQPHVLFLTIKGSQTRFHSNAVGHPLTAFSAPKGSLAEQYAAKHHFPCQTGGPEELIIENGYINGYRGFIKEAIIPEGVIGISPQAFYGCVTLEKIVFPESLKRIEEWAFGLCCNLKEAVFPEGLEFLDYCAFGGCTSLRTVSLSHLKEVSEMAFVGCQKLHTVRFGEGIRKIDRQAFFGCEELYQVEFPESLEEIGDSAFERCALREIKLPDGVKKLGDEVFASNKIPLSELLDPIRLPQTIESLGRDLLKGYHFDIVDFGEISPALWPAFENTYIDLMLLPKEPVGDNSGIFRKIQVKTLIIPGPVRSITDMAFKRCTIEELIFCEGIEEIGEMAFAGCSVQKLSLPASLKRIGKGAFCNCPELKTVIFNEKCQTVICAEAFSGCKKLKNLIFPERVTLK